MYVHLLSKYMNMHEFGAGIHLKLQVSMANSANVTLFIQ